jgi:hypothetical protein
MANEAYFIVQRKYFHVLMKVLSFFIAFSTIFYSQEQNAKDYSELRDSFAPTAGK